MRESTIGWAEYKLKKNEDVTICHIVTRGSTNMCGIIYKGLFYVDDRLDDFPGQGAYVIEDTEGKWIYIFTPNRTLATGARLGAGSDRYV